MERVGAKIRYSRSVAAGIKNTKGYGNLQLLLLDVEGGYDLRKADFYSSVDLGVGFQLGPATVNWSIVDFTKDLWGSIPEIIEQDWAIEPTGKRGKR